MKISKHLTDHFNAVRIRKNSPRDTIGLGQAVSLISKKDRNFDKRSLINILSNGGLTALIITDRGRIMIPQTYWAEFTEDIRGQSRSLDGWTIRSRDLMRLTNLRVVAARKFLRELGGAAFGMAFEADYPELGLWLRLNAGGSVPQNPEEIRDKLDDLLEMTALAQNENYVVHLNRFAISPYIGGRDGLSKQKPGAIPTAMPDEFWLELMKYFVPFKNSSKIKIISGNMLNWAENYNFSSDIEALQYNEVRIKKIAHLINKIGKNKTCKIGSETPK